MELAFCHLKRAQVLKMATKQLNMLFLNTLKSTVKNENRILNTLKSTVKIVPNTPKISSENSPKHP